jgi:hypothetical protein
MSETKLDAAAYSAVIYNVTPIAGSGYGCLQLIGSPSRLVKVRHVALYSTATGAAVQKVYAIVASALTGGTSGGFGVVNGFDTIDPAATAAAVNYTSFAGVSAGGTILSQVRSGLLGSLASPGVGAVLEWRFDDRLVRCPTLRGTSQTFSIVFDAAVAGQIIGGDITWTESGP